MELGDFDRALKDANIAIEKDREDHDAYDTRGQIYMKKGKNEDALKDFNYALSLKPNYIVALENRARCYRKLAETEQDEKKKAELNSKAEADEKKAEELKKGK
jgi:tetratricopeptide (TPR) repeat protein